MLIRENQDQMVQPFDQVHSRPSDSTWRQDGKTVANMAARKRRKQGGDRRGDQSGKKAKRAGWHEFEEGTKEAMKMKIWIRNGPSSSMDSKKGDRHLPRILETRKNPKVDLGRNSCPPGECEHKISLWLCLRKPDERIRFLRVRCPPLFCVHPIVALPTSKNSWTSLPTVMRAKPSSPSFEILILANELSEKRKNSGTKNPLFRGYIERLNSLTNWKLAGPNPFCDVGLQKGVKKNPELIPIAIHAHTMAMSLIICARPQSFPDTLEHGRTSKATLAGITAEDWHWRPRIL